MLRDQPPCKKSNYPEMVRTVRRLRLTIWRSYLGGEGEREVKVRGGERYAIYP